MGTDELQAALRRVINCPPWQMVKGTPRCWHCGADLTPNKQEPHDPDCVLTQARQALARPPAPDAGARVIAVVEAARKWRHMPNEEGWWIGFGRVCEELRVAVDNYESALDGDADARGAAAEPAPPPGEGREGGHSVGAGFLPKLGVYRAECDDCDWESPVFANLYWAQEAAEAHAKQSAHPPAGRSAGEPAP